MTVPTVQPRADVVVRSNAYTGPDEPVTGTLRPDYAGWAMSLAPALGRRDLLPTAARPEEWTDPTIGWGLVLPDRVGLDNAALGRADDAPEPIRALVAARSGKVLRHVAGTDAGDWTLRDYAGGGDLLIAASPPGTGPKQLPMYLLIYGSPTEIPWHVQYALNPVRYVGRLDLTGDALSNYVTALLDDWSCSTVRYDAPVVWAVDFGNGDITSLMRGTFAAPLAACFESDPDMPSAAYVDGSVAPATRARLRAALIDNHPAVVVTSSHGMTGPLDDLPTMRASLGLLVDTAKMLVRPECLLADWQPDGAIWFAQACCSAGSNSPSWYHGLFKQGSVLDRVLDGVAAVGATVAPLPKALLGAAKPLRAFIGHVEPTFDWTLALPANGQPLTASSTDALYRRLCLGQPVGLAMSPFYEPIGSLLVGYERAVAKRSETVGAGADSALDFALNARVSSRDRASTVLLGDPTVSVRLPAEGGMARSRTGTER